VAHSPLSAAVAAADGAGTTSCHGRRCSATPVLEDAAFFAISASRFLAAAAAREWAISAASKSSSVAQGGFERPPEALPPLEVDCGWGDLVLGAAVVWTTAVLHGAEVTPAPPTMPCCFADPAWRRMGTKIQRPDKRNGNNMNEIQPVSKLKVGWL
jgi:hypothetical protein